MLVKVRIADNVGKGVKVRITDNVVKGNDC